MGAPDEKQDTYIVSKSLPTTYLLTAKRKIVTLQVRNLAETPPHQLIKVNIRAAGINQHQTPHFCGIPAKVT